MKYKSKGLVSLAFFCFLLQSCAKDSNDKISAPKPVKVNVAEVLYKNVDTWDDFTGRLMALQSVEVKPRVSGYITDVFFKEGSQVEEGDLLYKIDARLFQAEVDRFTAKLNKANIVLEQATRESNRITHLVKTGAISEEKAEERSTSVAEAKAELDAIKAELTLAQLNLSFTNVRAPLSGKVSRNLEHRGNLVSAGESALTTVMSTGNIHAAFNISENLYYKYFTRSPAGESKKVYLKIFDDNEYSHQGYIDFIDNSVNPSTGLVSVRAIFANKEGLLIPGVFSRLRLLANNFQASTLILDRAIGTDLENRFVLVVNEEGKTEYRKVKLGKRIGELRVILSGINEGEKIVVNGLQKVRPGSQVDPVIIPMSTEAGVNGDFAKDITRPEKKVISQQNELKENKNIS